MKKELIISIFGLGVVVGGLTNIVDTISLWTISIGLGLIIGGIFRAINKTHDPVNNSV